jgi:predicted DNA-binding transcriptional regulator YafY
MANPTTRVLALLELLQAHGLMSGTELARRLAVDPRSIRRYILSLESLGIPVQTQRGRDGGYHLMQGFKLPPMMFSNEEAAALALGLVSARSVGWASASASALAKLERVMPETVRANLRAVAASLSLELPTGKPVSQVSPEILSLLSSAIQQQQSLRLSYSSGQQISSTRNIDAYGLAYLNAHWYVVAYCHLRLGMRSFRLDRISALELLPASFGKPLNFDTMAYLNSAIASLPRAHSIKVVLHTDLASALVEIFSSLGVLEVVDAGILMHSQADDLAWMARELARLPFSFTIVEPPALGLALAQHLSAVLQNLQIKD